MVLLRLELFGTVILFGVGIPVSALLQYGISTLFFVESNVALLACMYITSIWVFEKMST